MTNNDTPLTENPLSEKETETPSEANAPTEAPAATDDKAYQDLNNQYLRLAADFDNFRKRTAQERENLLKYGAASTLLELLPVLDNLERGAKSLNENTDAKTVLQSMKMLETQLHEKLKALGLTTIPSQGLAFDPEKHEALSQVPSMDHPENTVIEVYQQGYMLHDKVIRPAQVVVSVLPEESNTSDSKENPFKTA